MRRLSIIGEAVKHLSAEIKSKQPDIPWKDIAGMRDILIHEYAGVQLERIWNTIQNDLPPLKDAVKKLIWHKIDGRQRYVRLDFSILDLGHTDTGFGSKKSARSERNVRAGCDLSRIHPLPFLLYKKRPRTEMQGPED